MNELFGDHFWIVQVFIIVLLVLVANFFFRKFLDRAARQLEKTANPWDDAVLHAARRPLNFAVWVVGLTFAAEVVVQETGTDLFTLGGPARSVGIILSSSS